MKKLTRGIAVMLLGSTVAATLAWPASAATLEGVSVPDQATVDGKSLMLNGLGLRTATMLKVKVYVIGLYLESKSSDAEAIISLSGPKRIEMHFMRAVTAKQLRDGWSEAFEANYKKLDSIKAEIEKFNASMRDVKSGDLIALDFTADAVEVSLNGAKIDSVPGADFQQAALSIWLGRKPPNKGLKEGLLGG